MLAVVRACGDHPPPPSLTALRGLPCTVSAATPLYPFALAYNLDPGQLAQVSELASCFLCTQVRMEPMQAAIFAKQLYGQAVSTVGTFLGITHEEIQKMRLPVACVGRLDKHLQQLPGLPENLHAAPGTAVPTRLLCVVGAAALAHPTGVVCFCCAYHAIACANVL